MSGRPGADAAPDAIGLGNARARKPEREEDGCSRSYSNTSAPVGLQCGAAVHLAGGKLSSADLRAHDGEVVRAASTSRLRWPP